MDQDTGVPLEQDRELYFQLQRKRTATRNKMSEPNLSSSRLLELQKTVDDYDDLMKIVSERMKGAVEREKRG